MSNTTRDERIAQLYTVTLTRGSHEEGLGMCAMEAAAWLAGEKHTDRPRCVCPLIASLVRRINDAMRSDEERVAVLRPLLPIMLDTRSSGDVMARRVYIAADWAVRDLLPIVLRAVGMHDDALACEGADPIGDLESAERGYVVAHSAAKSVYNVDAAASRAAELAAEASGAAQAESAGKHPEIAIYGVIADVVASYTYAVHSIYGVIADVALSYAYAVHSIGSTSEINASVTRLISRMCAAGS